MAVRRQVTATPTALARAGVDGADSRRPEARLAALLDPGTVEPLCAAADGAVRAVHGRIGGAPVVAYATDPSIMGGAMGAAGCAVMVDAIGAAVRRRCPVIGIWHTGGARLPEGMAALDAVGAVFAAMVAASGRVPQISLALGPAAGGAAYGPALTDVVVLADAARVFVTGPDVVRGATGQQVDMRTLGGPQAHSTKSGLAHVVAGDEADAITQTRRLAELLGRPGSFDPELARIGEDPGPVLPDRPRRAYDVRPLLHRLVDTTVDHAAGTVDRSYLELQPKWAPNVITALCRLGGRTVGLVANNPLRLGGCLESAAAEKAARFVRMCDSLGVPLVVVVDVPGYLPGVDQEWGGIVRRGAKLLHAFAEATVPRVTLVTRKAFGGAYIAMNSKSLGATRVYAWPSAQIAVMAGRAAVGVLHRRELAAAADDAREALRERLAIEYDERNGGVHRAVALGLVDEVIAPAHSRERLIEALASAPAGRGWHGNIPL
jgi:acetyl-CoA/propionyl-CoA carboxylase carboxyl transferase subunit